MPSPVLIGGSPSRLYHHAGKWVLEIVRHVNLGHDLIRPTTQRLTGQRAIASYFKSNPDKAALARATLRLIQTDLGDQSRTFNLEGEDWIAGSLPPPREYRLDSYRPTPPPPALETEVSELRAQVVVLSAVQEGLLQRLARLESKLAAGQFVARRSEAPQRRRRRDSIAESALAPEVAELDAPELGGAGEGVPGDELLQPDPAELDETASAEPDGGGFAPAASEPEAPPPPAPPPPPERQLLALPPVPDLAKCVALLVGGDVWAREAEQPMPVNRTSRDCYCTSILDDHDQTVGLILMDLKATVCLGGTLMMLPKMEIDQQLKMLSPGEDSIAASAEICNALSGAINGAQEQHVRVGALEKFEFKAWSWVAQPADRRDLQDSFGGRTVVFSKPLPETIG